MSTLLLVLGVCLFVAVLTGFIRQVAVRAEVFDVPVLRSAHKQPIPVGGGLAIVLVYVVAALYLYASGTCSFSELMAALGAVFIAAVGFVDDYRHLDIAWRLPLQLGTAFWSVAWLGDVPGITFGSWLLPASWLLNGLAVVALVWLLNLYNFMDGIDGLAGSELVFVTAMSLLLVTVSGDPVVALISAVLLGGGMGFLFWNWAPAKIFMGDVGSGFAGFACGVLALLTMHHGSLTVWTWVLLLGVFIADSSVTLVRRYVRGEKWYEGHSHHAYQHAARHYKSHAKVTITVMGINCCWLAPLAWFSAVYPEWGMYLALVGVVPLLVLAIKLEAGIPAGQPRLEQDSGAA